MHFGSFIIAARANAAGVRPGAAYDLTPLCLRAGDGLGVAVLVKAPCRKRAREQVEGEPCNGDDIQGQRGVACYPRDQYTTK